MNSVEDINWLDRIQEFHTCPNEKPVLPAQKKKKMGRVAQNKKHSVARSASLKVAFFILWGLTIPKIITKNMKL